ncbi:MAG: hypothetical protein ACOYJY_02940 [Acutalibacteraceae bacterium]|jgi:hypothetical protein
MRKKRVAFIVCLSIIAIAFALVLTFYSRPLVKANDLLVASNCGPFPALDADDDNTWISNDDFRGLRIVPDEVLDTQLVNLKTQKRIRFEEWKTVVVSCDITAEMSPEDNTAEEDVFRGQIDITFVFRDWEWKVVQVKRLTNGI